MGERSFPDECLIDDRCSTMNVVHEDNQNDDDINNNNKSETAVEIVL